MQRLVRLFALVVVCVALGASAAKSKGGDKEKTEDVGTVIGIDLGASVVRRSSLPLSSAHGL